MAERSRPYLVAALEDGHAALDLGTGELYRVNAVGAAVCQGLTRGHSVAQIVHELSMRFDVERAALTLDVERFAATLEKPPEEPRPGRSDVAVSVAPAEGGFFLKFQGNPVLWMAGVGTRAEWHALAPSTIARTQILTWAAPHLVALQGLTVLHASAVEHAGGVSAFVGASGAGKTTLARALRDAGATLVSEDLLVLEGTSARLGGERVIAEWAEASASADLVVDARDLAISLSTLACLPLGVVALLDAARRQGQALGLEAIGACDALGALLANAFAEVEDRDVWSRVFVSARVLVEAGLVRRTIVPDGLAQLAAAARGYTSSSTS